MDVTLAKRLSTSWRICQNDLQFNHLIKVAEARSGAKFPPTTITGFPCLIRIRCTRKTMLIDSRRPVNNLCIICNKTIKEWV